MSTMIMEEFRLLSVKISIKDGDRQAELEITEADNLSKLVIIQNVFNLFGIDKDIFETVSTMEKIGRVYSDFFDSVNPIENVKKEAVEVKSEEIREKMIEGLKQPELIEVYKTTSDQPEWVTTGIKIGENGNKRYRCRYHCTVCNHRGSHYIYEDSKETWCHSCRTKLKVSPAHPEGFRKEDGSMNHDTYTNFFRAGEYKDWNLEWSK